MIRFEFKLPKNVYNGSGADCPRVAAILQVIIIILDIFLVLSNAVKMAMSFNAAIIFHSSSHDSVGMQVSEGILLLNFSTTTNADKVAGAFDACDCAIFSMSLVFMSKWLYVT